MHVQPVNHIGQRLMVCLGLARYHARKCLTVCDACTAQCMLFATWQMPLEDVKAI